MVAGIAAGLVGGHSLERRGAFAVWAAGTAAVLTPGTELCEAAVVERLIDQVAC